VTIVHPDDEFRDSEYTKKQNQVYDDYIKGNQNYTALARKHGLTRAEVMQMISSVNDYVRASGVFKEMAKERLHQMDRHYAMLIQEGWDAIEVMKEEGTKAEKIATTIKAIADIEAKRQDALQKAGMYDDYEVGDMLAETEAKMDAIKELLKQVIKEFPQAKAMILTGLRDIQDPNRLPEPEVIGGEVVQND